MCDWNTQAEDNVEEEEGKVRVEENLVGKWNKPQFEHLVIIC